MTEAQNPALPLSEAAGVNRNFAGVRPALGLAVWFFLFQMPFGSASVIVARSHPRLGLFLGLLAMLSMVPGVIWVAKSAWGEQWRKALPLAPVSRGVLVWTVLCNLAFLPVEFVWFLAVERSVGFPNLPDPLAVAGVLGVVLAAPIGEEILFRSYGLARIRELAGDRRALVFTALVFALLHGSWVKLPGTFATGLFLGWLVLRTGSLWPAFLGHFTINGTAWALSRTNLASTLDPAKATWAMVLLFATVGVASLAILGSARVRMRIQGLNAPPEGPG